MVQNSVPSHNHKKSHGSSGSGGAATAASGGAGGYSRGAGAPIPAGLPSVLQPGATSATISIGVPIASGAGSLAPGGGVASASSSAPSSVTPNIVLPSQAPGSNASGAIQAGMMRMISRSHGGHLAPPSGASPGFGQQFMRSLSPSVSRGAHGHGVSSSSSSSAYVPLSLLDLVRAVTSTNPSAE